MKIKYKVMTVILTVIFIYTNYVATFADRSLEIVEVDYRNKYIQNIYGNTIEKPVAKFAVKRSKSGEFISAVESYAGNDLDADFPTMDCYVGDTITFEDLSSDPNSGSIATWDWQYYGHLGDHFKEYNYNIVNQSSFNLDTAGTTTFFLCVKSNISPKKGSLDPWSENGNHQTVGKNKWFPNGMYWYFTAITVVVHPASEAKVNVRYWDTVKNQVFHEEVVNVGQLLGEDATLETSIHVPDWEGYKYLDWNVQLPDGGIQYSGFERDVGVTLASWLPEKYLNVEFLPIVDTEVKVRYWDSLANRVMYEESKYGDGVAGEEETKVSASIPNWDGYTYQGWNVQLLDGTVQYSGDERIVDVILNGYIPLKYLNIEYLSIGEPTVSVPLPTPATTVPDKPSGTCDGEITWTETDSHQVFNGYNRHGEATYKSCKHTFKYKVILSAAATVTPETFKSGYGFETAVNCSLDINLISNSGCSNWGNNRVPSSVVKNPTKATVYIPWSVTNRLGTQGQAIVMDSYGSLKFRLPQNPISEIATRKIYTDVSLAGTEEEPVTHYFDIYVSGGGVGGIEFCKKLTKSITINGDMYSDDFSGMD